MSTRSSSAHLLPARDHRAFLAGVDHQAFLAGAETSRFVPATGEAGPVTATAAVRHDSSLHALPVF
ncbi:hypothetical protein [Streptomyces sp. DSM 118148]|uniref:hypothetical protein n=1 Tax=Streptomyces sp. DSM 118148 TaxID=3448667 RepID=UPI0040401779